MAKLTYAEKRARKLAREQAYQDAVAKGKAFIRKYKDYPHYAATEDKQRQVRLFNQAVWAFAPQNDADFNSFKLDMLDELRAQKIYD